jgi:periplasmic divalent cation tolerance protein
MIPATTARIVLSTAGSAEEAATIARILVEEQLAACVNISPGIRSIYRWQDEIHDEPECLLLMKTSASRLEELESRLQSLHSYENPEFLVLNPESGSEAYLMWIAQSLSNPARGKPLTL